MTDQWSDQIFDSLVEEMLTNQHPPDLTEQIQQRLREERALAQREQSQRAQTQRGLAQRELAPCADAQPSSARVALERPSVSSTAPALGSGSLGKRQTHAASGSWHGAAIAGLSLSAGLLLALAAWQFWSVGDADNRLAESGAAESGAAQSGAAANSKGHRLAADRSTAQPAEHNLASDRAPNRSHIESEQPAGPSTAAPALAREDLSLESLPFSTDAAAPDFVHAERVAVAQPVKPWSDEEVVAWLDERFSTLWARKQVQPKERLAAGAEAARVALVLTGGALSASDAPPRELADKLLRSASFAEHWSDRLVTYWLRGTPAADKNNTAGAQLRSAVAQQIVARKPWNEVVAGLIDSQPGQPEATFLAVLAGGGNHRLAGRLGSAVLDEALACARCHDASDNGRFISTDQDEYWSLVAIFNGIDSRDDGKLPNGKLVDGKSAAGKQPAPKGPVARELVDRQNQLFADGKSPNVFFDRPDGRLQAAQYRLPGGDNWRSVQGASTPRESLARWIASTSVTDHAAVNTAWRLVYGRPLVAQHAALDGEGWAERRELLDGLAKQFQAHGRDLSKLVGWLIASEPFRTQPLAVDRQKWLLASDDQIDRWNFAATNFANFQPASANKQQLASLDSALASVVRWSNTPDERRATLAQPGPIPGNAKGQRQAAQPQPTAKKPDEAPATYLVRSLQPTAAQRELIRRLVASKLSWAEQVEHIAGLVGESGKSGKLQKTADELLELKNGDRSAALFQLLQSALLCEEAL